MARKTHRPDDIVWIITAEDIAAAAKNYGDIAAATKNSSDRVERTIDDDAVQTADDRVDCAQLGAVLDKKYPRKAMVKLFEDKLIHVNDHKANPHTQVSVGDTIWLAMPKEKIDHEPVPMDLHILYEDDDLLVVDKPAGITVNSPGQVSLANGIAQYFKDHSIKRKVRFLNRLDRDTSGCIVIAKSGLAQSLYQQQMEQDIFEKWYRATVEGIVADDEGSFVLPMVRSEDGIHYEVNPKGKETRTDFTVIQRNPQSNPQPVDKSVHNPNFIHNDVEYNGISTEDMNTTVVDIRLWTGKTHQIRVAFSHAGHPLVGDTLYGAQDTGEPFKLRAIRIVFTHMRTGQHIEVTA